MYFPGPVAQSGRAPPWHGGSQGFKSPQVHQPSRRHRRTTDLDQRTCFALAQRSARGRPCSGEWDIRSSEHAGCAVTSRTPTPIGSPCADRSPRVTAKRLTAVSMAGSARPAAASTRTAVATSGHSLTTSTVPCSRMRNWVARGMSSTSRRVSPLLHRGCLMFGGRQLDDLQEVGHQAEAVGRPPERHPEATTVDEHPSHLAERFLTPVPDAVEARDGVEAVVVEREREHVVDTNIGRG
jgi:hypothetical protein